MTKTVLLVEDDPDVREAIALVLTDQGYVAIEAANGREALEFLRSGGTRPDLILLDVMMPVMNGLEFREEQLADPDLAGIPVIVISAHADGDDTAHQMKASGFLKKPVSLDALLQILAQH